MRPVSKRRLLVYGIVAALVVGAAGLVVVGFGGAPLQITPLLSVLLIVLAALLDWAGLHVKRLKAHQRTWATPLIAMRIAVAARASALVASVVVGALLGVLVASLSRVAAAQMASNALAAGLGVAAGLTWCVIGYIVERWCIVDDDSEEGPDAGRTTASPA